MYELLLLPLVAAFRFGFDFGFVLPFALVFSSSWTPLAVFSFSSAASALARFLVHSPAVDSHRSGFVAGTDSADMQL